jgi:hypothetical protein
MLEYPIVNVVGLFTAELCAMVIVQNSVLGPPSYDG